LSADDSFGGFFEDEEANAGVIKNRTLSQ